MRNLVVIVTVAALLGGAEAAGAAEPKSLTATSGSVTATVTWIETDYQAEDVHVAITRDGQVRVDETLRDTEGGTMYSTPVALLARDLDGEGEPEVILDLYTGGAHCCTVSRIYRYTGNGGNGYETVVHDWGNEGYLLRDLDGDGQPEFRSADDRFNYRFACYACGGAPVQIWQFRGGDFVAEMQEVTRSFPAQVRKDASLWWKAIQRERRRRDHDVRGLVAAWTADQYLLGNQARAAGTLQNLLGAGELTVDDDGIWPSGRRYVRELKSFLRRLGYDKLPA